MPTCSPVLARARDERVDAARSAYGAFAGGIVVRVGRALARRHARVRLDQLACRGRCRTDVRSTRTRSVLPMYARRHRVQRASDLHVVVGMHLGGRPERHVEAARSARGSMCGSLLALEDLARHLPRRAVHARAGDVAAPLLGVRAEHVEVVAERLAVEPALAHVRHLVLDARLVLRSSHARRVDEEAARLRVVRERRD